MGVLYSVVGSLKYCAHVCISHTCRNVNFTTNVPDTLTLMPTICHIVYLSSVKSSSSKKKKKKKIPTDLPYFCSARYANITIFFFWPNRHSALEYFYYNHGLNSQKWVYFKSECSNSLKVYIFGMCKLRGII